MAMMLAWTLNAQVDTIVTASGELGNSGSDLEFLNESGGLTRFPRLSDAGELLYYPPLVATDSVTNITSTSAMVYGNILFNGWYENVQEQGFQLSTTTDFSGSVTTQAISPENPYADCELPCVENVYSFIFTGLTPITTYYVRAYAANEQGTAYGDTLQFATPFGCGISTVQDYDGNVYNTVQIGSQCWTKENLKTTHFTNGTAIPLGSTTSTTVAYRYNPNNDAANVATYGYLYNWPAVMNGEASSNAIPSGVQGICPEGWHVPSDREWQEMEFAVGMSASDTSLCNVNRGFISGRLSGDIGWQISSIDNVPGNINSINHNSSGFSALPAGYRSNTSHDNFGVYADFVSCTEADAQNYYGFYWRCNLPFIYRSNSQPKNHGRSVRCIHDTPVPLGELPLVTTNIVTDITYTTATCGGNVVYEGNSAVTVRGVCWSTSANPTVEDSHTEDGNGQGSFVSTLTNLTAGTTYHVRAYAINSTDTVYGEEVSFLSLTGSPCIGLATVTDYDGNVYNTVKIGNQCWMRENLKTTKYSDGTTIAQGSSQWYYPNNRDNNKDIYGLLYTWRAVMRGSSSSNSNPSGVQGVCPNGWHVPSDSEWGQLISYVSSQSQYTCSGNSSYVSKSLASVTGWNSSTNTCDVGNEVSSNNSTGFSGLPAGGYLDTYYDFEERAIFWSATESNSAAYYRSLSYNSPSVGHNNVNRSRGCSVRCVKD